MDSNTEVSRKDNNMLIVAVIIVILLLIVGGAIAYLASQNMSKPNIADSTPKTQTTSSSSSSGQQQPQTTIVDAKIEDMSFPAEIKIKKGETVRWTNDDITAHTVTFSDLGQNSGILRQGEVYEFKFDNTGTFNYSCTFHPTMTGKVIVE